MFEYLLHDSPTSAPHLSQRASMSVLSHSTKHLELQWAGIDLNLFQRPTSLRLLRIREVEMSCSYRVTNLGLRGIYVVPYPRFYGIDVFSEAA